MGARAVNARLRRGDPVDPDELRAFAKGLADGSVSDAQAGAFAMGVCLRGLGEEGRVILTEAMRDSGDVLRWDLPGPVIDKHSTGGLGDCVSLVLAPALAACGAFVPMISGRGLGHTGGTLDKMEAIPGVSAQISEEKLRQVVGEVGCAVVGATGRIAPADRRLYAVRDVTGTVESVDLITASILSKKLAAGLEALVLDVKCGSGAFMKSGDEALALARSLVTTANGAGCRTAALITDMDEPLAPALGNALEVGISMEVLSGNRDAAPRLHDLTVALAARALALTGEDEDAAAARVSDAIASGAAMERFARMVALLGGPPDMDADWRAHLKRAPVVGDVVAPADGVLTAWDGEALGLAVVAMGGGRQVETDRIDPAVGLSDVRPLGTRVARGEPVATAHAADEASAEAAAQAVQRALTLGEGFAGPDLVIGRVEP
ncbi:thymidine phosphorylase [Wenxinia marina]|uniref:Thymidine phosphorylase n=1 Tax=Wenxinia marina DSM 24838 TaxID=1123501 RepID=A0A0D0Q1V7_9RHOB|nr:thymidine phosphorylase [Wenxinia marina]KIQ68544.1 thymidine phosphorylase [Wenxinia marina DSM 24838]GGL66773.1 thymidine phosphorylase [Wenxinia marina]